MGQDVIISDEVLQGMGISEEALQEIVAIVGRLPKIDELSTLLAMWDANGRQQSLLGWLRGQRHDAPRHDYLYSGSDTSHTAIREPRIRECIDIAHSLDYQRPPSASRHLMQHGDLIYMVGNISTEFVNSDYARRYLHLAESPVAMDSPSEQADYTAMILHAAHDANLIGGLAAVTEGGLFGTLVRHCADAVTHCGFDILTCREVRLDAFLFGEEAGRFIASLTEQQDDTFLLKMDEAGLNCCFLGRATRGRLLIDGMDFGDIDDYLTYET